MEPHEHHIQDAAEHYAVLVMQRQAENIGVASASISSDLDRQFISYLAGTGLNLDDFTNGKYPKYKLNVDAQVPNFVDRLAETYPGKSLDFENVEAAFRNLGMKGDFVAKVGGFSTPIPVSLKNYVGSGGILRPQVASGTFASFAASFVFDRAGVGTYVDPRTPGAKFKGSDVATRNKVLRYMDREDLIPALAVFDGLQAKVRKEFLSTECEMYDKARVKAAAQRVAQPGIDATLKVFSTLGPDDVRRVFLSRIGLDGKEEALYFDSKRYVDSITNRKYHDLRVGLNEPDTEFHFFQHGQGIRFTFDRCDSTLLAIDVPFTINTNGAWYRPNPPFEGTQFYNDKGVRTELRWGQRRPRKSKEIATSVNTYVNLANTGIFD